MRQAVISAITVQLALPGVHCTCVPKLHSSAGSFSEIAQQLSQKPIADSMQHLSTAIYRSDNQLAPCLNNLMVCSEEQLLSDMIKVACRPCRRYGAMVIMSSACIQQQTA